MDLGQQSLPRKGDRIQQACTSAAILSAPKPKIPTLSPLPPFPPSYALALHSAPLMWPRRHPPLCQCMQEELELPTNGPRDGAVTVCFMTQ